MPESEEYGLEATPETTSEVARKMVKESSDESRSKKLEIVAWGWDIQATTAFLVCI